MTTETMIRICQGEGCNADISHRHPSTKFCPSCRRKNENELNRQYREALKTGERPPERFCVDCGVNITDRPAKSQRCEFHASQHHDNIRTARRISLRTGQTFEEVLANLPVKLVQPPKRQGITV